jgi:putative membrane protein
MKLDRARRVGVIRTPAIFILQGGISLDHAITETCVQSPKRREQRSRLERVESKLPPHGERRMALLLQWILCAIALMVVSRIVPGFVVTGLVPALIASVVIGLLNATVGLVLKIVTFPISIITLGIFLLVINGLMILLASSVVPGFHVRGFVPAFWGAVVLALLGMVIKAIVKDA